MCSAGRPQEYHIPDDYVPDDRERVRLQQAEFGEQLLLEEEERQKRSAMEERDRNFQQHMSVALRQPLIANQEETECPICFDTIPVGEGVVLRECLHIFCRECLAEHIKASQEPEVQCPYDNGDFQCHDVITNQEIQELLNDEDFQKYLQRSLATAESQEANSFHCQTPNCHGWCIYDDEVNDFDCPVCQQRNCLTCKAIHFPVNCKEYQDDLKRNAANDEAAKKTQEYLEQMLRTKDGMNCPTCGIILVKKDGCDWMKCSMCKTEICWAVRGPRWGPGGPGDTSGGCKCRVNNVRCDPQCKNCH
ncbi:ranBP-type and C3HC4-type zinc finger-containing 1-like [Paramuricea clavata]|uniref:RanBP-type and C3HC4-type zinc finger-containing 1-like n=2 Tax=Paramuricea clavata TaxID=317549 RepID=A0A6S7J4T5_PARCT|nr:ranBP-type and C3HC4-type zinc finger-containing 1-like [Paramuricea clavata]